MGCYEDLEKSMLEAIEIEKGNIKVIRKDNMPAPTFFAADMEDKNSGKDERVDYDDKSGAII